MGEFTELAAEQRRALERLGSVPELRDYYLAGGGAIAMHLGHRRSRDVDLFSATTGVPIDELRAALVRALPGLRVIGQSDVTLKLELDGVAIDVVNYPYPPLDPLAAGPGDFRIASRRDLAVMKLAAIARRGLRRDFWDLHALIEGGISLDEAAAAYRLRYGRSEADLYHVMRSLTYFADGDAEPVFPHGLTEGRWSEIKAFFRHAAPRLLTPAS